MEVANTSDEGDPITTEVVRHALNCAARQMMRAFVRTAVSPLIFEVFDFAVAIYDRNIELLAQAPTNPIFMGTLGYSIEAAVAAAGGAETLAPGDIIVYNWPYGSGSHAQDCVLVMPAFFGTELVGYSAIKAHWTDIGAKDFYSTDTVDVYQEGTFFPGLRLYKAGKLDAEIHRLIIANSRVPAAMAGELDAHVIGVRAGAAGLVEVIERFGLDTFRRCVAMIFDHGEAIVRGYFAKIPDGRYPGVGQVDSDGLTDECVRFDVAVVVSGSSVTIDLTNAPDATKGPINSPLATTVSCCRVAIAMLAGNCEMPTEGHFRPLRVLTRPGSLFHATSPSPCFLYGWPPMNLMEVILRALSDAVRGCAPARSGGDLGGLMMWGHSVGPDGLWADGCGHPCGQGAHARGDGANALIHFIESASRFTSHELWETRLPVIVEKMELATDSGGPGKYRGGLGVDVVYRWLEDCSMTAIIEQTKSPAWGLEGGGPARPNKLTVTHSDGSVQVIGKATGVRIERDARVLLQTGGGGGYGPPQERERAAVLSDVDNGYITESSARLQYPHAFAD
jgi:N-methylhydantoinase B